MASTLFGFPFNPELFSYTWQNTPDPVSTALVNSGAVQMNGEIATQISQGSDYYTVPFYNTIGGVEQNYDGQTDIVPTETTGVSQSGVVFGRAKAWTARDFVGDFHKADPMSSIVSQVQNYWSKQRQARIIGILNAVFASNGTTSTPDVDYTTLPNKPYNYDFAEYRNWCDRDRGGEYQNDLNFEEWWRGNATREDRLKYYQENPQAGSGGVAGGSGIVSGGSFADHTTEITGKLTETSIGDACVKACGDLAVGNFSLAILHSTVAQNLANKDLLEYRKYTDPQGIQRQIGLADINGMTVVVSDQLPVSGGKYTSYVLGNGAIQFAPAVVKVPVETHRDPYKNGGQEVLITRIRETLLPNGFTYSKKAGDSQSPTNDMLFDSTRYTPVYDPKCIAMAKIVSEG